MIACPLCSASPSVPLCRADGRDFLFCTSCELRFVPATQHLSLAEERSRYDLHENDPEDPAYREFLAPTLNCLTPRLPSGSRGLDFGAGPGPALARMFEEAGFPMDVYDPFFHPASRPKDSGYGFVTCTEALEHFRQPRAELDLMERLLKPGGWLAIRTQRLEDWSEFERWHYRRDPTHVAFYSEATMRWIGRRYDWACEFPAPHVTCFQKPWVDTSRGCDTMEAVSDVKEHPLKQRLLGKEPLPHSVTLALHDLNPKDAVAIVERKINHAVRMETERIKIMYDDGRGKTKRAIHEFLSRSKVVKRFEDDEDRPGVTWVYLI